jgi:hypothetical protein
MFISDMPVIDAQRSCVVYYVHHMYCLRTLGTTVNINDFADAGTCQRVESLMRMKCLQSEQHTCITERQGRALHWFNVTCDLPHALLMQRSNLCTDEFAIFPARTILRDVPLWYS